MPVSADSVVSPSPTPKPLDHSGSEMPSPDQPRGRWRITKWVVGLGIAIGLFFALLVPTMCRSSEVANRIKCASNLRQLGLAMKQFAEAHGGQMPASWQALAEFSDITADVFICPSGPDDRAVGDAAKTWTTTLDDPAVHHNSYSYAGQHLQVASLTDKDIIAFEIDSDHSNDGVNLLFGDGSVDWQTTRQSNKAAYDRLLADYAAGIRPLRWKE